MYLFGHAWLRLLFLFSHWLGLVMLLGVGKGRALAGNGVDAYMDMVTTNRRTYDLILPAVYFCVLGSTLLPLVSIAGRWI